MKRIFYSVIVAALGTVMFSSCSNDDVVGADKTVNYQANFEKVFGQLNPNQNFNTQKTVTIESSLANAKGNYTLRVYDAVPTRKGASLIGKFENLNAGSTSTLKVDVNKATKNIYCIADNGESHQVVTTPITASNRVSAKFDATGAPTNEPTYNDDQVTAITVAFEDLGSTDDFDFNDAVIKVEYATGTGKANVTLMAVGAVLPLKLYYVGGREAEPLFDGQELHSVMGYDQSIMINTNWKGHDKVPFVTCEIEVPEDFTIGEDGAPFILEVNGTQEQRQITASTEYGAVPQVLVVGKYHSDEAGKTYFWRWPKERVRLNLAFPGIEGWMTNPDDLSFLAGGVENNLYNGYDPTVEDEQPAGETPEGLEAIDLGLPSRSLWANMNVGATAPEEYGGYYAWGETEEKEVYDDDNYIYNIFEVFDDIVDDIAGTEYDVAHVKWGGDWQMPSGDQIQELMDYTNMEWTKVNGVFGRRFSSKAAGNSNSIFIPAAGWRSFDSLWHTGEEGNIWSSTQHPTDYGAYALTFTSDDMYKWDPLPYLGYNVRPVKKK